MRPHAAAREGQPRRMGLHVRNLMSDIFAPAGRLGSGDLGGVSTRRSKGC